MSKQYNYLVVYSNKTEKGEIGLGSINITLEKQIDSIEDIREIEKFIKEKASKEFEIEVQNVVILNYQLLSVEGEVEDNG